MSTFRSWAVLLRFHLASGVRVALRAGVPIVTLAVALAAFTESGLEILSALNVLFFPPDISPLSALAATLVSVAYAGWSSRWVTGGLWGWIRHLPASGVAHRRAATAGLVVAQAPLLVVLLAAGLLTMGSRSATTIPRLIGLLLLAWSASHASLRGTALYARLLAFLAGMAALAGSWWLLLGGFTLAAAADALAGRIQPPRKTGMPRRWASGGRHTGSVSFATVARIWTAISLRALRWRLVSTWWIAALVLVPLLFFVNNNELSLAEEALAVRLAGLSAVVMMMASLADTLAHRRPVWPWSRSLPWSARSRVGLDAVLLSTTAIPVLAAAVLLRPGATLPVLATSLVLAVRGAAAIRQPFGTLNAPSTHLMVEGFIAAGLVALVPWAALGLVVLLPLVLRWGGDAERRLKTGRWQELGPVAGGDSQSWGGS